MDEMSKKMDSNASGSAASIRTIQDTLGDMQKTSDINTKKCNKAITAVNNKSEWLIDQVHEVRLQFQRQKMSHQVLIL